MLPLGMLATNKLRMDAWHAGGQRSRRMHDGQIMMYGTANHL